MQYRERSDSKRKADPVWYPRPGLTMRLPFQEAAEIGTKKVIEDHSTIGLVVITDGSITDIPRENYLDAEERVIGELKDLGKPFVIILNSTSPTSVRTQAIADELYEKHNVGVIPVNAAKMSYDDLMQVMMESLYEFPVTEVNIALPRWVEGTGERSLAASKL